MPSETIQRHKYGNGIAPFFDPQGIAIVGSFKGGAFGALTIVRHLVKYQYQGRFYPINPSYETILDNMKVYPSILDVPGTIDLVEIITPPESVPEIMEQCARKGVKAVIIVSDGFSEKGVAGAEIQRKIVEIASRHGMRVMGPNTIGVTDTATGLMLNPFRIEHPKLTTGSIGLCTQTGSLGHEGYPLEDMHYWVSRFCDFGNKCDVSEVDLLHFLADDPATSVIAMHLEDIKDGPSFMQKAKEVVARKPVLIVKGGRTKESARIVASHTGSLSGEDRIYDAAFRQSGVIRARSFADLLNISRMLATQPLPRGNRLAIFTLTGAGGVIGADTAVESGLVMAEFSENTKESLARWEPALARNPVDIGTAQSSMRRDPNYYMDMIKEILDDENVDCLALYVHESMHIRFIDELAELSHKLSKPMATVVCGSTLNRIRRVVVDLEHCGYPTYFDIESAVRCLGEAYKYSLIKAAFEKR